MVIKSPKWFNKFYHTLSYVAHPTIFAMELFFKELTKKRYISLFLVYTQINAKTFIISHSRYEAGVIVPSVRSSAADSSAARFFFFTEG
jgi:hypothetical protein